MMIVRKTPAELEKMRRSGLLVWQILQKLKEMAVEGCSTMDLEVAAVQMMADAGAKPAFKGYYVAAAGEQFKFVLCTSVNEEVIHGMPNPKRILKKGDLALDRHRSEAGRVLWRFGDDGSGGRGQRSGPEASESDAGIARTGHRPGAQRQPAVRRLRHGRAACEGQRVFDCPGVCGPWYRHAAS